MVSGIGTTGSLWADYRAKTVDASVQGRLGLAAAQAYLQAAATVIPAAPSGGAYQPSAPSTPQTTPDQSPDQGTPQGQFPSTTSPESGGNFQPVTDFSQMLAAQEAASLSAQTTETQSQSAAVSQTARAIGAYSAALALTEEPSSSNMQVQGWNSGQTVSLTA